MSDQRDTSEGGFWSDPDLVEGVIQTSLVGITVVDASGTVTFVNKRAEEIYGRSREEINEFTHNDSRWDLVDENGEPLEEDDAPFDRVVASGEAIYDQVLGLRRPSGERVWVSVNGAPQWDDDGELERAIFAFEDVNGERELEAELDEILGRVTDAFYALDEEFRFTHVNERAEELLQASEEELLGEKLWDLYPESAEIDDVWDAFHTAMETQESQSYELYFDPLEFWVEATVYPSETGVSVYFRDVTERKERESERTEMIRDLQESEERLQLALKAGEMGSWELDLQTEDAPVHSTQHDQIFGYEEPVKDWNFETFLEHVHPEDREEVEQRFEDAFETGSWEFECRIARVDGEQRVISAQGEFYYDSEGEPVRAVGVVQDITERKERERELERALDLLNKTEQIADVAGWEVDPDTNEPYWSDHLFDILDVDYDEQPSLDQALSVYHSEDDRKIVENAVDEALETGEQFDVEARFPRPCGDVGWLRVQGDPEVADGEIVSLRGAVQDVTAQKEHERRLEELVEKLQESNERLEQFAYAASHDLQEPLRMVSSYLQLIEQRYADDLDEDGQEFIDFAVDGADRMREMIQGLLEYSRVETQGDPFEPVDLGDVLAEVLDDLHVKIAESSAEITIAGLPSVEGDRGQLRQVFQNLLENAIAYSGEDPPRVSVDAKRHGDRWLVSVEDDGIGIEADDSDRIFEVFESLHTNDEHSGTGIGLALCKRIVERHGGDVWVESEPGEGSTFRLTLPRVQ